MVYLNGSMNISMNSSLQSIIVQNPCRQRHFSCPMSDIATQVEYVGYVYVQSIICGIGLILNIINFSVFVRSCFETSTYVYMSALSFVDACTLLVKLPGCFLKIQGTDFREVRFGLTYYIHYFEIPISNMFESVSVWLTLTLAMERFIAMRYFSFSRTACTQANARFIIIGLVLSAMLLNIPQFFLFVNQRHQDADGTNCLLTSPTKFFLSDGYKAYSWLRNVLVQFAPLVGLVVANICLLLLLRRHSRRMKHTCSNASNAAAKLTQDDEKTRSTQANSLRFNSRRSKAQRKLTILLVVIIFTFLFGQIPQALAFHEVFKVLFAGWLCPCTFMGYVATCPAYRIYRTVAQCLVLCSYSATFFVYLSLNRHFRDYLCNACKTSCMSNAQINDVTALAVMDKQTVPHNEPCASRPLALKRNHKVPEMNEVKDGMTEPLILLNTEL